MLTQTNIACFLSLAETLNFTKTAEKLFLTQQAVSKNIIRIEQDFGFQLFKRTSRSVILTNEGEKCYVMLSRLLNQFNTEIAEIRKDKFKQARREIRVGYQEWLDLGSYTQTAEFSLDKAGYCCEVSYKRYSPFMLYQTLVDNETDIIIMYGRWVRPETNLFKNLELCNFPIYVLVAQDHPQSSPGADYKSFLSEKIYCAYPNDMSDSEGIEYVNDMFKYLNLPTNLDIQLAPNIADTISSAIQGKGIALGSDYIRVIYTTTLNRYPIDYRETLYCVWNKKNSRAEVEMFARYLRNAITNETL